VCAILVLIGLSFVSPIFIAATLYHFPFSSAPHLCLQLSTPSSPTAQVLAPVPFSNVSESVLATSAAGQPFLFALCSLPFASPELNCSPGSSALESAALWSLQFAFETRVGSLLALQQSSSLAARTVARYVRTCCARAACNFAAHPGQHYVDVKSAFVPVLTRPQSAGTFPFNFHSPVFDRRGHFWLRRCNVE
jgi:hypothetical protein